MKKTIPFDRTVLAVTWEHHRRMLELSDWLGLELQELSTTHRGLRRYLALGLETWRLLRRTRPATVFVQNPSLILATLALLARPFCGRYRVIVDAHNEAVTPFTFAHWPLRWLARRALRLADVTVVTNAALAQIVTAAGGRALVLPDRLPRAPVSPRTLPLSQPIDVMVVATYAADEPIAEILEAARVLGEGYRLSFTGNPKKLDPALHATASPNVRFTGFLPEDEYWQLMARSHVVLDLTLKPNCLVCGAYEALALHKPMVLTGNPASRDLFGRMALFPDDDGAAAIVRCLRSLETGYVELLARLPSEAEAFQRRWNDAAAGLRSAIAR